MALRDWQTGWQGSLGWKAAFLAGVRGQSDRRLLRSRLAGYGSVVAPSVGSYVAPSVGSTNVVPTWRNTGPAAPLPRVPTVRNTFRNSFARMRVRSRSTVPTIRASGVHR